MDLRYIRYFVTVAEELNFTRAAKRLSMAQPPLSVQIRKLEREVGAELLTRDNRNVELTDAGRVFLSQARQMLALAQQSVAMTKRAAAGEIGYLSIAYTNPAGFLLFPKIIPAFKSKWPDVHLTFQDLRIPQQIERLRREELDLGFVWLPIPTDEFDIQELAREPYIVVLPEDHRLAQEPAISTKQLSQEPLILIPRDLDPESRRQIEGLFQRTGATMNVAYELETLLSVIGFVAMGCGCGILPRYVRNLTRKGVVFKRLRSPNVLKSLAIVKRKKASDLAQTFFEFASRTMRNSS
jgi:DNA-binding transcriptional LysR family regulator